MSRLHAEDLKITSSFCKWIKFIKIKFSPMIHFWIDSNVDLFQIKRNFFDSSNKTSFFIFPLKRYTLVSLIPYVYFGIYKSKKKHSTSTFFTFPHKTTTFRLPFAFFSISPFEVFLRSTLIIQSSKDWVLFRLRKKKVIVRYCGTGVRPSWKVKNFIIPASINRCAKVQIRNLCSFFFCNNYYTSISWLACFVSREFDGKNIITIKSKGKKKRDLS